MSLASTLTVSPTNRVYLLVSTEKNTPPGQCTLMVEAEAGGRHQTIALILTGKRINVHLPLIMRSSTPPLAATPAR